MWYVLKTRQDNDMTDHIGAVYAKNDNELLWHVGLGDNYDEKQTRQLWDETYMFSLH